MIKGVYLDEKSLFLEQKRRNAFLREYGSLNVRIWHETWQIQLHKEYSQRQKSRPTFLFSVFYFNYTIFI
jgi:hypothetical protein